MSFAEARGEASIAEGEVEDGPCTAPTGLGFASAAIVNGRDDAGIGEHDGVQGSDTTTGLATLGIGGADEPSLGNGLAGTTPDKPSLAVNDAVCVASMLAGVESTFVLATGC